MRNIVSTVIISVALACFIQAQKPAYLIYDSLGQIVEYDSMIRSLSTADIVMFGEMHDDPVTHWLQYEVTSDLDESRDLILGAEMIEADNQDELNMYLLDSISAEAFDSTARLWSNYKTDYAPLVNYAKDNALPFIATNIPRRFAQAVFKYGFAYLDSLSAVEKEWVAPLPIPFDPDLPKYQEILEMMGDHGTPELVKAQATKDATMAHFILKNFIEGNLFIHYNGSFHSDDYEGILWYLKQQSPELKYASITSVRQDDIHKLEAEHIGKADFIICVDSDFTRSY
ncbi:MAG: ChaN family lipoprotein [Saprospiraceae bacterium]|nr:ChaN family lipoprotein [Saprospiraceae bacterium]